MTYLINQRAWFVARENFKTHKIEYLHDKTDHWYIEGVVGYTTKIEAHERADKYKGEDKRGVFLMGPNYGRYRLKDARKVQRQPKNTQLARFELLDRMIDREGGNTAELAMMIRDFALTHGIWKFSNLAKTKDFLVLVKKYNALTDEEIVELVYETE